MRTKLLGRRRTIEEKRQIVAGYERSGQKQREYATGVGVGLSTLGLWIRQLGHGQNKKPRLMEVDVIGNGGSVLGTVFYRLSLPGGMRLEMGRGFEIGELRALLRILKEAC